MAQRSPRGAADQPQIRRQLRLLHTGVTMIALLGGIACYALLQQLGLPPLVAALGGLVFALVGRGAMSALVRGWLLSAAQRARSAEPRGRTGTNRPPERHQPKR